MELSDAILGFLDWKEMTGYELKGVFSDLDFLPWSGNNNQIYTSLLALESKGLVSKQTVPQEKYPAQKRYTATAEGKRRLAEALQAPAEAPLQRNDFLLHLAWSECLTKEQLTAMIDGYQRTVELELIMCREKTMRGNAMAARSGREEYIWGMIGANRAQHLQNELDWLTMLRNGLTNR